MSESTTESVKFPGLEAKDVMTEILREGAQRMLAQAIREEVEEWIAQRAQLRDGQGRQQVVRNGYLPKRTLTTVRGAACHRASTIPNQQGKVSPPQ